MNTRRSLSLSVVALGAGVLTLAWAQETAAPSLAASPAPSTAPVSAPPDEKPVVKIDLAKLGTIKDTGTMDDAVPDEKGVRRSIVMGGLDKITARTTRFEAPVGVTVRYKKLLITPHTCYVRPPEEIPETSVFVDIAESGGKDANDATRLYSGWMFASSPGLNGLEHPVYDVWVIGCKVDDPKNPGAPTYVEPKVDDAASDKPSIDDDVKDDGSARE